MRKILLASTMLIFSLPAFAEESGSFIKIIHEDGHVDVIDIAPSAPAKQPEPPPIEVTPDRQAMPGEVKPAQVPMIVEEQTPKAPAEPKAEKGKPDVSDTAMRAPAPKPLPVKKPAAAKKEAPVKTQEVAAAPPVPQEPRAVTPPRMPVQRTLPEGSEIGRSKAIAIAIDYAPPSSDIEVFLADYEEKPAYAVVFKTEDGFHEVIIDKVLGTVLDSRESQAFNTGQVRPGHLPDSLR